MSPKRGHKKNLHARDHLLKDIEGGKIALMYALEAQTEQRLIFEMERLRDRRKKLLEEEQDHISLKQLTEALANMTSSFKLKGKTHNRDVAPSMSPSKSQHTLRSQTSPGSVNKSILYPKPAEYQRIQKQNELVNAKQEILAKKLEDQLLKTKW